MRQIVRPVSLNFGIRILALWTTQEAFGRNRVLTVVVKWIAGDEDLLRWWEVHGEILGLTADSEVAVVTDLLSIQTRFDVANAARWFLFCNPRNAGHAILLMLRYWHRTTLALWRRYAVHAILADQMSIACFASLNFGWVGLLLAANDFLLRKNASWTMFDFVP